MKNPALYSIGLNKDCFSMRLFFKYIIYALWHSWICYFIGFYCLNIPSQNEANGKAIGLWSAGQLVFGVCIFVANFQLAINFNTHTVIGVLTLLAGPLAYFVIFPLISYTFHNEANHLFGPIFDMAVTYLVIIFCVF